MAQRQCTYRDMRIRMDHFAARWLYGTHMQGIPQVGSGSAELEIDDGFQFRWAVDVQWRLPAHQVHGTDQAQQTEVMIAVQVADEDVTDPLEVEAHGAQPFLRAFTTIDQVVVVVDVHQLRCGKTASCGKRRTRAQRGDGEQAGVHLLVTKKAPQRGPSIMYWSFRSTLESHAARVSG